MDFLRRLAGDAPSGEADDASADTPAPETPETPLGAANGDPGKKPRRVSVEGHTGVYIDGRRKETFYEIGFLDADKKQKWEPVGPDLDEAIARRQERVNEAAAEREQVPA